MVVFNPCECPRQGPKQAVPISKDPVGLSTLLEKKRFEHFISSFPAEGVLGCMSCGIGISVPGRVTKRGLGVQVPYRPYAIPYVTKLETDSGRKSGYYAAILSGKEDRGIGAKVQQSTLRAHSVNEAYR